MATCVPGTGVSSSEGTSRAETANERIRLTFAIPVRLLRKEETR
jgi:hypothetical protein